MEIFCQLTARGVKVLHVWRLAAGAFSGTREPDLDGLAGATQG